MVTREAGSGTRVCRATVRHQWATASISQPKAALPGMLRRLRTTIAAQRDRPAASAWAAAYSASQDTAADSTVRPAPPRRPPPISAKVRQEIRDTGKGGPHFWAPLFFHGRCAAWE